MASVAGAAMASHEALSSPNNWPCWEALAPTDPLPCTPCWLGAVVEAEVLDVLKNAALGQGVGHKQLQQSCEGLGVWNDQI